jgi:hypothetical protein
MKVMLITSLRPSQQNKTYPQIARTQIASEFELMIDQGQATDTILEQCFQCLGEWCRDRQHDGRANKSRVSSERSIGLRVNTRTQQPNKKQNEERVNK